MSGSVNKCIIIGNLGADPDVRTTASGQLVCTLSLATSESFTDKAGVRQERTFLGGPVDAWRSGALVAELAGQVAAKRSIIARSRVEMAPTDARHIARRLALLVSVSDRGCWEWTGNVGTTGYGILRVGRKTAAAHRVSYEVASGPIPAGMFVLHDCDNRCCVNPSHLHLGTRIDNAAEASERGRLRPPRCSIKGEQNGAAKLDELKVAAIREALGRGERQYVVADRFGVNKGTVSAIARRKSWAWMEVA